MDTVLWRVFVWGTHVFFNLFLWWSSWKQWECKWKVEWNWIRKRNRKPNSIWKKKKVHAAPVNMSSTDKLPAVLTFCIVKLRFEALSLFQVLQPIKPAALQNSISSTSLPDYQIYKNKHALGAVSASRLSMLVTHASIIRLELPPQCISWQPKLLPEWRMQGKNQPDRICSPRRFIWQFQ